MLQRGNCSIIGNGAKEARFWSVFKKKPFKQRSQSQKQNHRSSHSQMLRHAFSETGQVAFDEKGSIVDNSSMTGIDEDDGRSSRPQMLSRMLRGDELPKDGASLILAKLGALGMMLMIMLMLI